MVALVEVEEALGEEGAEADSLEEDLVEAVDSLEVAQLAEADSQEEVHHHTEEAAAAEEAAIAVAADSAEAADNNAFLFFIFLYCEYYPLKRELIGILVQVHFALTWV